MASVSILLSSWLHPSSSSHSMSNAFSSWLQLFGRGPKPQSPVNSSSNQQGHPFTYICSTHIFFVCMIWKCLESIALQDKICTPINTVPKMTPTDFWLQLLSFPTSAFYVISSSNKSQYSKYTWLFHSPVKIGSFCGCFSLFLPGEIVFIL